METDSFFWHLFKRLPETLFALIGLPPTTANAYRFDSLEIKKSHRIDGVLVPKRGNLPVFFAEVQFQRKLTFYPNLFAKVFTYLEMNDPEQDWAAVAIFEDRAAEPKNRKPYEDLLASSRVHRVYLDVLEDVDESALIGLKILKLVKAPERETPGLVSQLLGQAKREPDCEKAKLIVELVEELLLCRFARLNREELRRMFQLEDIRNSRVWKEACQEGRNEGRNLEKQALVHRWLAKGKSLKEIAELLEIPLADVRRLARNGKR